jgi:peroxiredoxin
MRRLVVVALALAIAAAVVVAVAYLTSDPAMEIKPGERAPDLALRVLHGGHPTRIPLLGQTPILLVFFDSRWPDSRAWLKASEALHKRYALEGLAVIGICVDEDAATATPFVEGDNLQFMVLHDPGAAASRAAYGAPRAPHAYLIDAGGRVVKAYARVEDLRHPDEKRLVAGLLPSPSPTPPQ